MRTKSSSVLHETLIREMVISYEFQKYYHIKADHIDYKNGRPNQVNGYIPDIYAEKNNATVVCEAETIDSINESSTIDQWKAFSKSTYKFHVVVPMSMLDDAKKMAAQNNINVDFWWYSSKF
jgi:hypothetical protein